MAVIHEVIRDLSSEFPGSRMPRELRAYLLDRYSSETCGNVMTRSFLYGAIAGDIDDYKAGRLDATVRTRLERLRNDNREMADCLQYYSEEYASLQEENNYMYDFIRWMRLEEMYGEFRQHAHKFQPDDEPFPYYTM